MKKKDIKRDIWRKRTKESNQLVFHATQNNYKTKYVVHFPSSLRVFRVIFPHFLIRRLDTSTPAKYIYLLVSRTVKSLFFPTRNLFFRPFCNLLFFGLSPLLVPITATSRKWNFFQLFANRSRHWKPMCWKREKDETCDFRKSLICEVLYIRIEACQISARNVECFLRY